MAENRNLDMEIEKTRRQAWRFFGRGLVFLAICLALSQFVLLTRLPFKDVLSESAIVAGWVAVWRPMELFLYDLPELRRERRRKNNKHRA